jgi:hypothetical protein
VAGKVELTCMMMTIYMMRMMMMMGSHMIFMKAGLISSIHDKNQRLDEIAHAVQEVEGIALVLSLPFTSYNLKW